jgi:copper chaperone
MITYFIENMTCSHCVARISRAIEAVAPQAKVEADLPTHTLRIETSSAEPAVRQAISDAGYPPLGF